jgi:hypothetical protein
VEEEKEVGTSGMAQVVEYLPSKCEARSSNLCCQKKNISKLVGCGQFYLPVMRETCS